MEDNAARIVSSAILGMDFKTIVVGGKTYVITPPTIKKIAGAAYHLSDIKDGNNLRDILLILNKSTALAHALSWLIKGDDSLFDALSEGTQDEVLNGIETAYSLLSTQNFLKLLALVKSVTRLTAKPKQ